MLLSLLGAQHRVLVMLVSEIRRRQLWVGVVPTNKAIAVHVESVFTLPCLPPPGELQSWILTEILCDRPFASATTFALRVAA